MRLPKSPKAGPSIPASLKRAMSFDRLLLRPTESLTRRQLAIALRSSPANLTVKRRGRQPDSSILGQIPQPQKRPAKQHVEAAAVGDSCGSAEDMSRSVGVLFSAAKRVNGVWQDCAAFSGFFAAAYMRLAYISLRKRFENQSASSATRIPRLVAR